MRRALNSGAVVARRPAQPLCSLLRRCGGCTDQSDYRQQLERKRAAIRAALSDVVPAERVAEVRGLAHPWGYRTKLLMPALPGKKGQGPMLGFYERGTTRLVDALGCPVQHPLTLAAVAMVRQVLAGTPIRATLPKGGREGWLHGVGVRVDPSSGAAELVLCGRTPKVPGGDAVAERLVSLPGVNGVHVTAQPKRTSYLLGDEFKLLAGKRRTPFHLLGEAFHLSPGAFFQTSHQGAELLGGVVREQAPETMGTLLDLYGGVGVFTRLLSGRWRRAVIAELGSHAVTDAKSWVKATNQRQVLVFAGRVEQTIGKVLERSPEVAVVDPPRSGCHADVVRALGDGGPPTIIYVACGLDALARDAVGLTRAGYTIDRVDAVDMFPHTPHVETVARFVRQ